MPNMTGLDDNGEESWDFFHLPLKNRVERFSETCERDSLEKKMIEATEFPYATSVVFPAYHDTSDYLNPKVIWPKKDKEIFRAPY